VDIVFHQFRASFSFEVIKK